MIETTGAWGFGEFNGVVCAIITRAMREAPRGLEGRFAAVCGPSWEIGTLVLQADAERLGVLVEVGEPVGCVTTDPIEGEGAEGTLGDFVGGGGTARRTGMGWHDIPNLAVGRGDRRRRRDSGPASLSPEGGLLRWSRWLRDEDAFGVDRAFIDGRDRREGRKLADGDARSLEDGVRER